MRKREESGRSNILLRKRVLPNLIYSQRSNAIPSGLVEMADDNQTH